MKKNLLKYLIKSNFNLKEVIKLFEAYNSILKNNLFDKNYYRESNPDLSLGIDLLSHYIFQGYLSMKNPSKKFDSELYWLSYPDVKNAFMNPLVHYVLYGKKEGKVIHKSREISKKEEIINTNLMLLKNHVFNNEPLISIIILNRNGLIHLKRLFKNFKDLTNYDNFEIIVVDNASSDKSVEFLNSLKNELNIRIIKNDENRSFSKGNNDAVKIANGEYLLLLNNDIEPTYGWLNEMVGTMIYNEDVGAVGAKLVFPYYHIDKYHYKSFKVQHTGDIFSERMNPCCLYAKNKNGINKNVFDNSINKDNYCIASTGAALLIKKSIYNDLGGLCEDYNYGLEDVDFSLKMYQKGEKVICCGSALLFHHESSTRLKSDEYFENDKNNFKIFWEKWGDFLSREMLLDKINGDKFFTEKNLDISFVCTDINKKSKEFKFISKLAKIFNSFNYELDMVTDDNNLFFGDSTDIIVSFSKNYNIDNIISRKDIFKVFISFDDTDFNSESYDLIINLKNENNKTYFSNPTEFSKVFLNKIENILKDKVF